METTKNRVVMDKMEFAFYLFAALIGGMVFTMLGFAISLSR